MVVSVSSDGNYAVSSNINRQLVLWDIKNKTHKIITTNANIYSAYFIKKSHKFMWQDADTNEVNVANTNGKILFSLNPGFPTFGQVMTSDLRYYFASDKDWSIYSYHNRELKLIQKDSGGFLGVGKLINLTLSSDDKLLLTSGNGSGFRDEKECIATVPDPKSILKTNELDDVVLWDVKTGKPLWRFPGNAAKTFATLSPDDQYIVSGDENLNGLLWWVKQGKLKFMLWDLRSGRRLDVDPKTHRYEFDDSELQVKPPDDFSQYKTKYNGGINVQVILALKFIDDTHYFRFTLLIPYVVLYSVDDPQPLKYIRLAKHMDQADLTKERYPAFGEYLRASAIDTTPKAHILVMAQQLGNGIIVYKYDPKTQTLHKIWVANF